ncbi:MAG: hypothetical protein IPH65_01305 [Dehalococcoidia bacterium]|uniref:hypothetical protein n=1 Tax=Candidatus Amarobacter glycogenicus TaxID=3140699 RepID=UPI002A0FB1C0|nr:hypothetical protein [Dehalococcoidia bacterium]MBK9610463.1 hypothetical protein [Dehalococcoidia bacterium]
MPPVKLMRALWPMVALLAMAACDDPKVAVGVFRDESGNLTILYDPCHEGRRVKSVELFVEGALAWAIRSEGGSGLREFAVGESAPDGFQVEQPLGEPIVAGRVRVEVNGVWSPVFAITEAPTGRVLVPGESAMSRDQFFARNTC